mgnify:CR=1 FL=1
MPEYLHNLTTLALVFTIFVVSNLIYHESGLLAVTVMGLALANQRRVDIRHVIEFKESLQVRIRLKHHRCYSCFAYGSSCSEGT